ncbi:MAG: HutD family protein, partial [Dokdonella sp.]
HCRLLAGPTRDFNVMAARAFVSAEIHARPLNGTMLVFVESTETWLIHVFSGSANARSGDQTVHAENAATLLVTTTSNQRERVVIEGGGELIFVKFVQLTSASESA